MTGRRAYRARRLAPSAPIAFPAFRWALERYKVATSSAARFARDLPELAAVHLVDPARDRGTRRDWFEDSQAIVAVLLAELDALTLRVGRPRRDGSGFVDGLPVEIIARKTNLHPSTVSAHLAELRDAGMLPGPGRKSAGALHVIAQPWERVPKTEKNPRGFRGLPAVRRVTDLFFAALGLLDQLRKARAWKAEHARDAREAIRASANQVQLARTIGDLAAAHGFPDG